MKVFISHSTKDAEIAKSLSYFLKKLYFDTDIFCSSISGTINQGDNFVKSIEAGLKNSDVFIPLISKNYNQSKYCLIELGYAYAKSISKKKTYHILPFCISPITKSEAMLGTPLAHINTALLNDKNDIENFLRILINYKLLPEESVMNCDIDSFINSINSIIMNSENILGNATILPICSALNNPDAIRHIQNNDKHTVNFNLFANGENVRPDFISLVFKFPGTFNFYDFLKTNDNISFICGINNYTESLTNIDIEFKYHESHQLLKSYKLVLNSGLNNVEIPIKDMNVEGLKQISEICFVCWDSYITEVEGMFSVENIQVR